MNTLTDHLGEFYGTNLKPSALDAVVARFVPPSDFSLYPELIGRKWFGYRNLSPGQSLFLFMNRFSKEFKDAATRNWGRIYRKDSQGNIKAWQRAPLYTKPHKWREFKKGTVRAFWNAMCHADDAGIPYDFYCRTVIEIAAEQGWEHAPGPNQLYHARVASEVKERWESHTRDMTVYTDHPFFKNTAYCAHDWQKQYADYLIKCIRHRASTTSALYNAMIQNQALPAPLAAKEFGVDSVRRAIDIAKGV